MSLHKSLANESFSAADAGNWNLGVAPAVLATTYMCQVPQAKPAGVLFLSVLIADLVLLQAIWLLFKLIMDGFFVKEEMLVCRGCSREIVGDHQGGVKIVGWEGLQADRHGHMSLGGYHHDQRGLENIPMVGRIQKSQYARIDEVDSDRSTLFARSVSGRDDHHRG